MKLERAIKTSKDARLVFFLQGGTEYVDAQKLGIEALKRLIDLRSGKITNPDILLPGETEE